MAAGFWAFSSKQAEAMCRARPPSVVPLRVIRAQAEAGNKDDAPKSATRAQRKEVYLSNLAAAKERRASYAPRCSAQLNCSDLPQTKLRGQPEWKRASVGHRSEYRQNKRVGAWASSARVKDVLPLCPPSQLLLHDRFWEWDCRPDHHDWRWWLCCGDWQPLEAACGKCGCTIWTQGSRPMCEEEESEEHPALEAVPGALDGDLLEEWEMCDSSSLGGSSWIDAIDSLKMHDDTHEDGSNSPHVDVISEASDVSFLIVDEGVDSSTPPLGVGLSWAERLAATPSGAMPPQHRTLRLRRPPLRRRALHGGVQIQEEEEVLGFGMEDVRMTPQLRRGKCGKKRSEAGD
mmetsp:Transcript_28560/g.66178  ORF Transcript_28560/g.66178 Transcript_28560/m.66178 type:complete len:346 (-) Transcript_28560:185-1222(-)